MSRQRNISVSAAAQRSLRKADEAFGDGCRIVSDNPAPLPEQGGLLAGKKNPVLDQALIYKRRGFSVLPIRPREKKPLIAWEPYQKECASEQTLTQWFSSCPEANIGIVTGAVSGIVVVDCDDKAATQELKRIVPDLKPIPRTKTGHGYHFFFKHPGQSIPNRVGILPKMDIRGDGGYVVVPPSVHPDGRNYEWQISLNSNLPDLPQEIYDLISSPVSSNGDLDKRFNSAVIWEGIPKGQRDDQLFRFGCQLRSFNAPRDVAEKLILEAASRCEPAVSERKALKKLDQAWRYEPGTTRNDKDKTTIRKPVLDRVSEIERQEISWLGYHRIPRGKITIIEGDPGQGKSFLTQAIAAAVSKGCCFPDDEQREPGNVIIMSAEDGAGDTIRPRLEDMQADLEKIALLQGMVDEKGNESFLTLADLDVIEKAIVQVEPALVIIDPIIAYVAGKDTHKAAEVRSLLAPLAGLAEKYNVAFVCVRHLNKSNSKYSYRGQGSIDFLAACRSAFLCGPDPENPELKVFCHIKSNVGPITASLNYSIANGQFVWGGEVEMTADQILSDSGTGEDKSRLDEAKDFLSAVLANGSVMVPEIEKQARLAGLSWHTVKRAKRALKVKHEKPLGEINTQWWWKLVSKK